MLVLSPERNGNMRSAQQAAFKRAFATRICSWQVFKQSMNVGRRRTDQLVRIFLDRRVNQLLDTIHHSSHGAHHFVNARLFLMYLRLRPPGPDRCLRVLSHVLETCVELHKVTSQSHASPSSCEGQRLLLCPQRTLRVEGLRVDMFHVEALATAELLKVPSKRMFNPLDLLHTQRLAQKAVLRLDVRLGSPRRKLRFLSAASKDLDEQQVCTIGDHAEGAAPVPSMIEQQHKVLAKSRPPCAHGSRTVRPTSRAFNFAQRGMRTARTRKCPEGASPTCCR